MEHVMDRGSVMIDEIAWQTSAAAVPMHIGCSLRALRTMHALLSCGLPVNLQRGRHGCVTAHVIEP
jgi:hypothetical protein